jgi:hypothetical protein
VDYVGLFIVYVLIVMLVIVVAIVSAGLGELLIQGKDEEELNENTNRDVSNDVNKEGL